MIVLDASAALDLVLGTERAEALAARVAGATSLHAPHVIDLEVAQALRRVVAAKDAAPRRSLEALGDFVALGVERHDHRVLLGRVWELRGSLTAYDAAYVALAELLRAPLLTCDARLARARGHRAAVELVR